ncbi:MAG: class I SAM-dependent methyltransferase [Chlamydiota bacterium]
MIDSGHGRKLEKVGGLLIDRPCNVAIWEPQCKEKWKEADAVFTREKEGNWIFTRKKSSWQVEIENVLFHVTPTDFGHLGFFPEHAFLWKWMRGKFRERNANVSFLNLFAYSGGASLVAAQEKAKVCHLDASKPMVAMARENAKLNGLSEAPIRWIVDDVKKFLLREKKREVQYDAILLDPPSFGRGTNNEIFTIEEDIISLLEMCKSLLSKDPLFVAFSCHTPGFTPTVLHHLLKQTFGGKISIGEMLLPSVSSFSLPSGSYAIWEGK